MVLLSTRQKSVLVDQLWTDNFLCKEDDNAVIGAPLGNSDHNSVLLHPVNSASSDPKSRLVVE